MALLVYLQSRKIWLRMVSSRMLRSKRQAVVMEADEDASGADLHQFKQVKTIAPWHCAIEDDSMTS